VIDKQDLPPLARAAGLQIAEEYMPLVLANLQRIEQVAQLLNQIELQPDDELPERKP
jgi:Asp-tRNA(Asn)/Glu-tRNA(Gln) amidotransferase C subunit